jgi:hypothetical protein
MKKHEFNNLERSLGLFMVLVCLAACQATTGVETVPTPLDEPTITLPESKTDGCQLGESFSYAIAWGSGYETAQEAIDT